eukprot:805476-Amphidinium_carterae.1
MNKPAKIEYGRAFTTTRTTWGYGSRKEKGLLLFVLCFCAAARARQPGNEHDFPQALAAVKFMTTEGMRTHMENHKANARPQVWLSRGFSSDPRRSSDSDVTNH